MKRFLLKHIHNQVYIRFLQSCFRAIFVISLSAGVGFLTTLHFVTANHASPLKCYHDNHCIDQLIRGCMESLASGLYLYAPMRERSICCTITCHGTRGRCDPGEHKAHLPSRTTVLIQRTLPVIDETLRTIALNKPMCSMVAWERAT